MAITVECPSCKHKAVVPNTAAGAKGKCASCGAVVHVPSGHRKICAGCGADVSSAKRVKDPAGHYFCEICWEVQAQPAPAKRTCSACGQFFPSEELYGAADAPMCRQCYFQPTSPETDRVLESEHLEEAPRTSTHLMRCPDCEGMFKLEGMHPSGLCKKCQASQMRQDTMAAWTQTNSSAQVEYAHPTRGKPPRRASAQSRSYLNAAVLTLILYFIGFGIVGFVVNLVYLSSARRTERGTGERPEGTGCLVALLWVFAIIPAIIAVVIGVVIVVLSSNGH